MTTHKSPFLSSGLARMAVILMLLSGLVGFAPRAASIQAQDLPPLAGDPTPPSATVKLIFIHHSTGENWLRDDYGGLGLALSQNNYFVSDTNYGWGPNTIGDRTDIPHWPEWFASASTPGYMSALYTEYDQHSTYTRTLADPGGENTIILFKSCFPNSALEGNPNDPPDPNGWLTVGHAKWVYNEILAYFSAHPEKLFIVIAAPPLRDGTYAANARAFNQWLMYNWLGENGYTQTNVAVFDFYNVLTGPNNHHRFSGGAEEHVFTPGMNTLYYPSGDDHPSVLGSQKATDEFIELLNVFYHRWNASAPTCHNLTLDSHPAAGGTVGADVGPNCGSTYYSEGTDIHLTPSANFGYVFTNWSGDLTGSDIPGLVTMNGDRAVTANFGTAPVIPPDGANLHTNQPAFDWPDYPGALYYQLQVSRNSAFTQLVLNASPRGETNSTYTPPVGLPSNLTLYWRYRARPSLWSYTPWSPTFTFHTAAPPSTPLPMTPFNNALVAGPSPLFDWRDSSLPAGTSFDYYKFQIAVDRDFNSLIYEHDITGQTNSREETAVLNGGATYYWRVRAFNTAGDYSAWSQTRTVRIKYDPPTLLLPADLETNVARMPTFTWDAVPGATFYTIQVSKYNTFAMATTRNSSANSYTLPLNLNANTTYYWRVRVNGLYGPSAWSATYQFQTGP